MDSKYSLAERVMKRIQARLSTDSKVSIQQAILAVGSARDKLLQAKLYADSYGDREVSKSTYITEYGWDGELKPYWDTNKKMFYITLPTIPIELRNDGGMVNVTNSCDNDYSYVRVAPFSANLYRGLGAANLPRPVYFRKRYKVYFNGKDTSEDSH